jgi:PTH1 family peptidyl-tRNA hydrolase
MLVDRLSMAFKAEMRPGKGDYMVAESTYADRCVYLVKPLTYVNSSGIAVSDSLQRYGVSLDDLLVVCDDCELPFGMVRIRKKGEHGGHRGLESIIYHLQTEGFPRLRIGIGKVSDIDLALYVLSQFEPAEKEALPGVLDEAERAARLFLERGVEVAMSQVNRREEVE